VRPTDILKNEHRVIELVLYWLEKIAKDTRDRGRLEAVPARDLLAFFRNFADRCHHGKEEIHLFPVMESKGFLRQSGPTGVMLYEHEQGREHLRAMDAAVDKAASGDELSVEQFCTHAARYVNLLREHIVKEEHCLFGMANQVLAPDDDARLMEQFERIESEHAGEGTHQHALDLITQLELRYGVAKEVRVTIDRNCGCGHHELPMEPPSLSSKHPKKVRKSNKRGKS
jgi:hemerythrin-like domain-containing protein